jgi:carbonic anhydrase/acetyltransferase-like protein (isoleucine patch superfamily)
MPLYRLGDREPQIAADAYVAPTATLIGSVEVAPEASVWFGALLRADYDRIVVGTGSCIQDGVVIHTADGLPTLIGSDVAIGHSALLEGCVIEDGALVSMGAIVLQRARVGAGAVVAAGSVVREGQQIPPGVLAAGVPAVVKKPVSGSSRHQLEASAAEYRRLRLRYLDQLTETKETRS